MRGVNNYIKKFKMSDIIINVKEFICESPIIGNVYRDLTSTGDYIFNWTSKGESYAALGLITEIRLFYSGDGQPEVQYTGQPVPFNAVNFNIGVLFFDTASFRLEFLVGGGDTCYYSIDIPYSSITII